MWQCLEILLVATILGGGGGSWFTYIGWEGARDAVKRPIMPRITPTTKCFPAQNASSAEVEKSWIRRKPLSEEGNGIELSQYLCRKDRDGAG